MKRSWICEEVEDLDIQQQRLVEHVHANNNSAKALQTLENKQKPW